MNNRCHDPIRKAPRLPGFYQKLLAGNALDSIGNLDLIMPAQWHHGPTLTSERALCIAILASAVDDIRLRKREHIEILEAWLEESDEDSTARISLPRVCQLLGLSTSRVRRQLSSAIGHARELGLTERVPHRRLWPKDRGKQAAGAEV